MLSAAGSIIFLIFGGCCTCVFTLEQLLRYQNDSGLIATASQFIFAAFASYPTQFSAGGRFTLRTPTVAVRKWFIIAAMFYSTNMLNNWAFAFNISVPVHIILRSFGSAITMMAGVLRGKRYTLLQVLSVVLLSVGVVVCAWADSLTKGKSMSVESGDSSNFAFLCGIAILLAAQLLGAWQGAYVEDTYADFGPHWTENLFYSHFLSLPLFLPLWSPLSRQFSALAATDRLDVSTLLDKSESLRSNDAILAYTDPIFSHIPTGLIYLISNAMTQLACISGVNLLASKSSAVTVTVVLNIRKLVSFVLSFVIFGHPISGLMIFGAALVFGSGALYSYETSWRIPRAKQRALQNGAVEMPMATLTTSTVGGSDGAASRPAHGHEGPHVKGEMSECVVY